MIAYKFRKKWSDSSSRKLAIQEGIHESIFKGHAYESEDDQLEFVSVIENMIRELFLCDELVCTSMAAKSSYSMKGEEIHSYGIIVESTNKFMTNIRYKFKNVCFNCYDAFSSLKELKDHKRQYHSY